MHYALQSLGVYIQVGMIERMHMWVAFNHVLPTPNTGGQHSMHRGAMCCITALLDPTDKDLPIVDCTLPGHMKAKTAHLGQGVRPQLRSASLSRETKLCTLLITAPHHSKERPHTADPLQNRTHVREPLLMRTSRGLSSLCRTAISLQTCSQHLVPACPSAVPSRGQCLHPHASWSGAS